MSIFHLKYFKVQQTANALKVGTDAMLLGSLSNVENTTNILDVGSGTGILALMSAQKNFSALITGLEIDENAADECALNFENSPWSHRLTCVCEDFLDWKTLQKFDRIISNPPYYQDGKLTDDVRMRLAKHIGELTPDRFFMKACELLAPQGCCELIIPAQDELIWQRAANNFNLHVTKKVTIFGRRGGEAKRLVLSFQMENDIQEVSSLTIREINGDYTREYIDLTREFHGVTL